MFAENVQTVAPRNSSFNYQISDKQMKQRFKDYARSPSRKRRLVENAASGESGGRTTPLAAARQRAWLWAGGAWPAAEVGVSGAGARRSEKVRPSGAVAPGRRWRGQAGVAPARDGGTWRRAADWRT